MQGAIVSRFKPVRTVLRQLIKSIDPDIAVFEDSDSARIEAMIHHHNPAFVFISLPSEADGGIQSISRIKSNFPRVTMAVMASYDYPEYGALSKTLGFDYLLYEENMDRNIIKGIVENAKIRR